MRFWYTKETDQKYMDVALFRVQYTKATDVTPGSHQGATLVAGGSLEKLHTYVVWISIFRVQTQKKVWV